MAAYSADYDTHGVRLAVHSEAEPLFAALDDLLHPFRDSATSSVPDVSHGRSHIAALPPACWRVMLHTAGAPEIGPGGAREWIADGTLRFLADDDGIYVYVADAYVARLHYATRSVQVWVPATLPIPLWDVAHVVVFPLLVEVWRRHSLYHLHAAALRDACGRVLLFPAASGSGKTTLTLALARGGFAYLTDDAALLQRVGAAIHVLNFPEPVNVTAATRTFFPEIGPYWRAGARNARGKAPLDCAQVFGTPVAAGGVAAAVLFPSISPSGGTAVASISAPEALLRLMRQALPSPVPEHRMEQFALFADLVERVPCFQLQVGRDFEALPHRLTDLLDIRPAAHSPVPDDMPVAAAATSCAIAR